MQIALEKHGYKFEKFTGDMTKQQRDTVLTEFEGRREEGGEEKRRRVEETPFPKIIKDSIEEKILKLQEKKEQLIQSTLDYQSSTTIKLTIDEIAELLR